MLETHPLIGINFFADEPGKTVPALWLSGVREGFQSMVRRRRFQNIRLSYDD